MTKGNPAIPCTYLTHVLSTVDALARKRSRSSLVHIITRSIPGLTHHSYFSRPELPTASPRCQSTHIRTRFRIRLIPSFLPSPFAGAPIFRVLVRSTSPFTNRISNQARRRARSWARHLAITSRPTIIHHISIRVLPSGLRRCPRHSSSPDSVF